MDKYQGDFAGFVPCTFHTQSAVGSNAGLGRFCAVAVLENIFLITLALALLESFWHDADPRWPALES